MEIGLEKSNFADGKKAILELVETAEIFEEYAVEKFLGSGTGGVVFRVRKGDARFAAKIIPDFSGFRGCEDNLVIGELAEKGVSFVNKLVEHSFERMVLGGKRLFFCVLVLGLGSADLKNRKILEPETPENWPRFFDFFGKLLLCYAEIHFKGGVLHGDIKPANILLSEDSEELEPIVIDFDLRLDLAKTPRTNDCQLRYAARYRARELLPLSVSRGRDNQYKWRTVCNKYFYSRLFLEDVYSLGATISRLIALNEGSVDRLHPTYLPFVSLLEKMVAKREERITTLDAVGIFLQIAAQTGRDSPAVAVVAQRSAELLRVLESRAQGPVDHSDNDDSSPV